jgi:hypothetical protein
MSSPGGPQQPYPNDQFGQQGGFPPPGGQPGEFPPPAQQGGFPPPPQGGGFPPPQGGGFAPPGPAPQPARRGGAGRLIVILVVVVVVIGGLITLGVFLNRDAASNAKVGDCVQQSGDDVSVVKCDDTNADFKVVGRVEDKTQVEASLSACDPFPDAESLYWEGKPGEKGLVLCLAPIK